MHIYSAEMDVETNFLLPVFIEIVSISGPICKIQKDMLRYDLLATTHIYATQIPIRIHFIEQPTTFMQQ